LVAILLLFFFLWEEDVHTKHSQNITHALVLKLNIQIHECEIKMSNETSKNLVFVMNSKAVMTDGTKVKHEKDGGSECPPSSRCRHKNEKGGKHFPFSCRGWSNSDSKLIYVWLYRECNNLHFQSKHRSCDHKRHNLSVTGSGCGS